MLDVHIVESHMWLYENDTESVYKVFQFDTKYINIFLVLQMCFHFQHSEHLFIFVLCIIMHRIGFYLPLCMCMPEYARVRARAYIRLMTWIFSFMKLYNYLVSFFCFVLTEL